MMGPEIDPIPSEHFDGKSATQMIAETTAFINQFEAGEWEVRYAGMAYRPYAHDTVPSAMQRFLSKWLLGVVWVKL